MLEIATTVAELEAQANEIISRRAMRISSKEVEPVLDGAIKGLKGDSVVEKLTVHTVNFNEDGTTTVAPRTLANRTTDSLFLESLLDEGKSIMVSNTKGDALCFSRINACGTSYLMQFRPQDAQTIRNDLIADLKAPKEPSAYDKICDFFARHILNRPGKAVAAYNEQKQFYDSMQKVINSVSNIPEEVEGFKQSEAQKQFDEQQRQEELERQRQLEEEARQKALQEEEARLKAEAELQKQEALKLKQQKAEEEKRFQQQLKQQQLKEALTKPQSDEVTQAQIDAVKDVYAKLPKQVWKKNSTAEAKNNNMVDVKEKEEQLKIVKNALENDKRALDKAKNELDEALNTVKDGKKAIKQMDDLKVFIDKKTAANEKLTKATSDVARLKKELTNEKNLSKQLKAEYDAVKGDEFLYQMTPKQYIQQEHVKNSEQRKHAYEETRKMTVLKDMQDVQREIELAKSGKDSINAESSRLDRAWIISHFRTKGKAMHNLDDKVAALEEIYADLQKQDAENLKAFKEQEEEIAKIERDFSPENLKVAEDFLNSNRELGKAKYTAYRASEERASNLSKQISAENKTIKEAETELKKLNDDPLNKFKYDANEHQQLKTRVPDIEKQIDATLKPVIKHLTKQVNDRQKLVDGSEILLENDRRILQTLIQSANEAEETLAKSVNKLVQNATLLSKRGLEIPLPPAEVQPLLTNMLSFQMILSAQQGQQAQKSQQAQQNQPQIPMV